LSLRLVCIISLLAALSAATVEAEQLAWSQSGSQLAWESGGTVAILRVYEGVQKFYDLRAKKLVVLGLAWPNMKRLLVLGRSEAGLQIFSINVDEPESQLLVMNKDVRDIQGFAIDRQKKSLRILARDTTGWKLCNVYFAQAGGTVITPLRHEAKGMRLSTNGRWILASTTEGTLLLNARNPSGVRSLFPRPYVTDADSPVAWAPNGNLVAFLARDKQGVMRAKIALIDKGGIVDGGPAVGTGNFDRRSLSLLLSKQASRIGLVIGRFYAETGRMVMVAREKSVSKVTQANGFVAILRSSKMPAYGFPENYLLIFRDGQTMPFIASRGASLAQWSPDNEVIAFLGKSRISAAKTTTVLGLWGGQFMDQKYYASDDYGEMACGDMLYGAGLYVSARDIYREIYKKYKDKESDISFSLLPRLFAAYFREGAREEMEPQRRKLYHALHYDPALFEVIGGAYRALRAYDAGGEFFFNYAASYPDSPKALRGIIEALNLAHEAGDVKLLRKILFDKGIPIYSSLLASKHPRIRYEPVFFKFLSEQVAARAPQVVRKDLAPVDILTFIDTHVFGTFPPVVLKPEVHMNLHLIIARTRRYRGKLRVAMSSYKRALRKAPEAYDTTAIWREIFETEAQLVGLDLPRPKW